MEIIKKLTTSELNLFLNLLQFSEILFTNLGGSENAHILVKLNTYNK